MLIIRPYTTFYWAASSLRQATVFWGVTGTGLNRDLVLLTGNEMTHTICGVRVEALFVRFDGSGGHIPLESVLACL